MSENELILERLLLWRKHPDPELVGYFAPPGELAFMSRIHKDFPTFTDWHSAGLILDALHSRNLFVEIWNCELQPQWLCRIGSDRGDDEHCQDTGPLAIRAAALAYIRSTT